MSCLHFDTYTDSTEVSFYGISDLRGQALLYLETSCVAKNEPCEFGDADDLAGDIGDGGNAVEGKQVMLAERMKSYTTQDDHLIVLFIEDA